MTQLDQAAGNTGLGRDSLASSKERERLSAGRSWLVRGIAAFGLERGARLASVAVIPLLQAGGDLFDSGPLFPTLAGYVLLTALLPRHRLLQGADLLIAAGLILLTSPSVAAYLPFILVAAAGPAAREGLWAGMAAGGVLGSLILVTIAFSAEPAALGLAGLVATILLPPLAGLTTAAASEVLDDRVVRDRRILEEANRLLSSLQAIADEVPGGLDISTVAASVMTEVRGVPGVRAAILLLEEGASFQQAGRTGRVLDLQSTLQLSDLSEAIAHRGSLPCEQLPDGLLAVCADVPAWLVIAMGPREEPFAVLLVGFDEVTDPANAEPLLIPMAKDAGLALENARLFEGTRLRAVDAARRQLASDLHDGVAQSLAHLRMELELLAMRDDASRTEAERLASVAESALLDLRRTITGLRLDREESLPIRLERHLREVRTPHGPRLEMIELAQAPLDATSTEEVFRVAQEAVSNALRHADAGSITVILDRVSGELVLSVEDDGVGLDTGAVTGSNGVGFASMRERASRLQARLLVEPADRGGTRVTLKVPARTYAPLSRS